MKASKSKYMHPLFENGTPIDSVLKYVKYTSYQRAVFFANFPSLYQQWVLDQFSRWQEQVFDFMVNNKKVMEAFSSRLVKFKDCDTSRVNKYGKVGRPFLLPASVPGSPAAHRFSARNSAAVVMEMGDPTHWITFTMDSHHEDFFPNARKIVPPHILDTDITPENYPWIVARLYRKLRKDFLADLREGHNMTSPFALCDPDCGPPVYLQLVDEFQKRYWPHFHLLTRLKHRGPWTTAQIDAHVSARLFHYEQCPLSDSHLDENTVRLDKSCVCTAHVLYRLVKRTHIHTCKAGVCKVCHFHKKNPIEGPCDNCAHSSCSKFFPKDISTRTYCDAKGFYHYFRPREEDRWIAQHIPAWILKYKNHIHSDMATGMHTVEYVHSYQHKGHDFTDAAVEDIMENPWKEFKNFQKMRHVSFMEAYLRMISMNLQLSFPTCTALYLHLEDEHSVCLQKGMSRDARLEKADAAETQLLRYFWRHVELSHLKYTEYYQKFNLGASKLHSQDNIGQRHAAEEVEDDVNLDLDVEFTADSSKKLLSRYVDTPPYISIKKKTAILRIHTHIARIEFPSSYSVEKYCLGLILTNRAVRSFRQARTVSGHVYNTFAEAAYELGYFSEHDEFERAFMEMIQPFSQWKKIKPGERHRSTMRSPAVRRAFITMCFTGGSAPVLFDRFWYYMSLDLPHGPLPPNVEVLSDEHRKQLLLKELESLLFLNRSSLNCQTYQSECLSKKFL